MMNLFFILQFCLEADLFVGRRSDRQEERLLFRIAFSNPMNAAAYLREFAISAAQYRRRSSLSPTLIAAYN